MNVCIGLFGTCGKSKWRDPFIKEYDSFGMTYFNPNKPDWKPEDAEVEADHLANDAVVLFPITGETYASGSLSEVGFSILNAIKLNDRRDFVIMIDQKLEQELIDANPVAAKESSRSRALVKQHLKKIDLSNIYVVENLEEMLTLSVHLYDIAEMRAEIQSYSLGKK